MTPLDLWAAVAASIGATSIAMRAFMLRPRQGAWAAAPAPVWIGLSALGIVLGMAAASLWFGRDHANGREALVYSALAVSSVALIWNLNRNGRAEHVRRQAIASEVEAVLQASGRPAAYRWDGRRHG